MKTSVSVPGSRPRSLYEIFVSRVQARPDRMQYRFIARSGDVRLLTLATLWQHSSEIALHLRARDTVGRRVLLACTSQYHFVLSLYACLLAGAIAVPAPPLTSRRLAERIRQLACDAGATLIIVDSDACVAAGGIAGAAVIDLRAAQVLGGPGADWHKWPRPPHDESSIVLLQYTSGSTSEPKGVMISHGNLLANCVEITRAMSVDEHSRGLMPLPLFHDMGLVGGVLLPLYNGCEATFIEPALVVAQPQKWLQAISKYGITHSGGPNFLYELASGTDTEHIAGLDLSSWRVAFCGAEPVRASTVAKFAQRFAPLGFRRSAHFPCYGLAECTVMVSGGHGVDTGAAQKPHSQHSTNCGSPSPGTKVLVVDPSTATACDDSTVGEIWLSGPSVAQGYWGRSKLTREVFGAHLADSGEGPFLRTGDSGMMKDGELHVQGRLKDLIIIRGRKFSPQDIEAEVALAHDSIQFSAAFSLEKDGAEHLGIVVETRREWLRSDEQRHIVSVAVQAALFSVFQLRAELIELMPPGAVPRTSSGKVRRSAAREELLARRCATSAAHWTPHREAPTAQHARLITGLSERAIS